MYSALIIIHMCVVHTALICRGACRVWLRPGDWCIIRMRHSSFIIHMYVVHAVRRFGILPCNWLYLSLNFQRRCGSALSSSEPTNELPSFHQSCLFVFFSQIRNELPLEKFEQCWDPKHSCSLRKFLKVIPQWFSLQGRADAQVVLSL